MSERIWDGLRKNALYKSMYTLLYFTMSGDEGIKNNNKCPHRCLVIPCIHLHWQAHSPTVAGTNVAGTHTSVCYNGLAHVPLNSAPSHEGIWIPRFLGSHDVSFPAAVSCYSGCNVLIIQHSTIVLRVDDSRWPFPGTTSPTVPVLCHLHCGYSSQSSINSN